MTQPDKPRCETCRFGISHARTEFRDAPGMTCQPAYVECRRYPPEAGTPAYNQPRNNRRPFPGMNPGDWCGEWQPLPSPPTDKEPVG